MIIVGFVRNIDTAEFLKLYKEKGVMFTSDIDGTFEKQPIFINEYMSSFNLKLYSEAKILKQKNAIQFLWFKKGRIFVRKNISTPSVLIWSSHDLLQFQNSDSSRNVAKCPSEDEYEDNETDSSQPDRIARKRKVKNTTPHGIGHNSRIGLFRSQSPLEKK